MLAGVGVLLTSAWLCSGESIWAGQGSESLSASADEGADRAAVLRFLRSKLQEAQDHYDRRQYQASYRMADAILTLEPELPFRREVQRIRRAAEARQLATTVVIASFESGPNVDFPASKIAGKILLENISDKPLSVGLGKESTLGLCEYVLYEFYGDGSQWTTQGTHVLRAPGDFRLRAGDTQSLPISFEIPRGRGVPIIQYISVTGILRPKSLKEGSRVINRNVPWQETESLVLAEDLRDLKADPWSALGEAYESRDARRIAASGFYWIWELKNWGDAGEKKRQEAIDFLLSKLHPTGEDGLDRLTMRLLEQLTGLELKPTKETWFRWAARRAKESGR